MIATPEITAAMAIQVGIADALAEHDPGDQRGQSGTPACISTMLATVV